MPREQARLRYLHIRLTLEGCRSYVPYHGVAGPPFHFPEDVPIVPGEGNWPRELCPCCHGSIGTRTRPDPDNPEAGRIVPQIDHETWCLWCGTMSPVAEDRAAYERRTDAANDPNAPARIVAQKRAETAARKIESAERHTEKRLAESGEPLTETERRHIWNGGKGSIYRDLCEDGADVQLNSLAAVGRAFLNRIGQPPDWDLILGHKGRVIGRWSDLEAWQPAAEIERPGSSEVLWRLFHCGETPAEAAFAAGMTADEVQEIRARALEVLADGLTQRPAA